MPHSPHNEPSPCVDPTTPLLFPPSATPTPIRFSANWVLLTRARQGMVILIPEGSPEDPTRKAEFYDPTFRYLRQIGFPII